MSPKDDEQAIGRVVMLAIRNPLITALIGLSVGGPTGSYIATKKADPRIDSIMVVVNEMRPVAAQMAPLQDTVKVLGDRVTRIEDRDARMAYLGSRKKSPGRAWERF